MEPKRHISAEPFAVWKRKHHNAQFLPSEALQATNSPMYSRTNDDATVALLLWQPKKDRKKQVRNPWNGIPSVLT